MKILNTWSESIRKKDRDWSVPKVRDHEAVAGVKDWPGEAADCSLADVRHTSPCHCLSVDTYIDTSSFCTLR